jgi:hypothetical protein
MASLLWARHIVSRFRDAFVRAPQNQSAADLDFPIRGVEGTMALFVPGAC